MKKTNIILSAAVAGLFAVSAHAGKKAEKKAVPGVTSEDQCKTHKDASWKDGKCWASVSCSANGCGKGSCGGAKTTDAPAATTTAPAATAPATTTTTPAK